MPHRIQAVGLAGIPGHEHQVVLLQPRRIPLQVVRRLDRLAVLVDAEEADVEIVAGILEVVRIAAEEGDVLLGREDQPHVGVFLVAVEVVQPALVERDHVAPQAGLVERLLLDGVHHRAALFLRLGRAGGRLHRRVDPLGHVLDAHQHVQFRVGALELLGLRAGVEAVRIRSRSLVLSFCRASAPT